jgi:hypothetical protein
MNNTNNSLVLGIWKIMSAWRRLKINVISGYFGQEW